MLVWNEVVDWTWCRCSDWDVQVTLLDNETYKSGCLSVIGCGRLTCSDIICQWLTGKFRSRWWYMTFKSGKTSFESSPKLLETSLSQVSCHLRQVRVKSQVTGDKSQIVWGKFKSNLRSWVRYYVIWDKSEKAKHTWIKSQVTKRKSQVILNKSKSSFKSYAISLK